MTAAPPDFRMIEIARMALPLMTPANRAETERLLAEIAHDEALLRNQPPFPRRPVRPNGCFSGCPPKANS